MTVVLRGVCPVLATPFDDAGAVDLESFDRMVGHVIGTGVSAVMFPGYASEFYKLSDAERDRLESSLLARTAALPEIAAVISVADHATTVAVSRLRTARDRGADAFNLLPPHRMAVSASAVERHFDALLEAAAPLPCVIHYAPDLAPAGLDLTAVAGLAARHHNLRLVKVDATHAGPMVEALAAASPPLAALVGNAGVHMIEAWRRGAVGVQPGCSVTEVYQAIWNALEAGNLEGASELHRRLLPHIGYWMQSVELVVAAEKEVLRRRGLIASAHSREPGWSLDATELQMIDEFMDQFGALLGAPAGAVGAQS